MIAEVVGKGIIRQSGLGRCEGEIDLVTGHGMMAYKQFQANSTGHYPHHKRVQ